MTGEFSVCQFFPDGTYDYELRGVDGKTAIECAARLASSVGARIGTTKRIIITDADDCTAFEWKHGEGITFPPEAVGRTV